jgi:hypothetical protein
LLGKIVNAQSALGDIADRYFLRISHAVEAYLALISLERRKFGRHEDRVHGDSKD